MIITLHYNSPVHTMAKYPQYCKIVREIELYDGWTPLQTGYEWMKGNWKVLGGLRMKHCRWCLLHKWVTLKVNLNWCGWVLSTYTFNMWNVSMYSIFASAEPFYILSFRCHCIIKIPEHAPEIFRSSCSWRSVLVLLYTSQTHVFRNPRKYLVEQNQWNAKQVLARPAFSLWRQHNVHVMEQWSTMRCCTTRHLTSNFRTRYTQIMWFLFSATSYDLVCF